jgi:hypothetical protein
MTAAHEENYSNRLLEDAVDRLCPVVSAAAKPGGNPVRKNEAAVRRYGAAFLNRMSSDAPFKTEEEAIAALAPIAIWFFRWALRQLAIQVIQYLWNRINRSEPVTVSAFSHRIG